MQSWNVAERNISTCSRRHACHPPARPLFLCAPPPGPIITGGTRNAPVPRSRMTSLSRPSRALLLALSLLLPAPVQAAAPPAPPRLGPLAPPLRQRIDQLALRQ